MNIAGIEGNSFSGKSELAEGLADFEYSIIREPSCYVETFPPQPSDLASARENLKFFADVERRRSIDALVELQEGHKVVMDRTLWTYVLYEYVLLKRFPDRPNVYQDSLDLFQRYYEDNDIVVPKILIVLTPGSESVLKQRILQRRPASIDFLNEWSTTKLIDTALEKIIGIYGPDNACKIINNKTSAQLISSGLSFLQNSSYKDADLVPVFDVLRKLVEVE